MLLTFGSKYPRPEKRKVFNFDGVSANDCSKIYVNGQIWINFNDGSVDTRSDRQPIMWCIVKLVHCDKIFSKVTWVRREEALSVGWKVDTFNAMLIVCIVVKLTLRSPSRMC